MTDAPTLAPGGLLDVPGFRAHGIAAGIKKRRRDLAIIHSTRPDTTCAAVFTRNRVQAAPVLVSKAVAAGGRARAVVVNSGCANACTGGQGIVDAEAMATATAHALGVPAGEVLVASTGVIGHYLPMDIVAAGIRSCAGALENGESGAVAQAIMTTDSGPKERFATFTVDGVEHHIGAVAKGAGMIHPDLGTMLAFIVTDAAVAADHLDAALKRVVDRSFNMISVDGDTSTNDMVTVLANGAAGASPLAPGSTGLAAFEAALELVCRDLALAIVADGEGATTVIEVRVTGAATEADARVAARAVSTSLLVKTAAFGRDPNWGRIIAAAGASGATFDPNHVSLVLGSAKGRARVVEGGVPCETLDDHALSDLVTADRVVFALDLGAGDATATAWGSDLTYEYVKINAEYTT